LCSPFIRCVQTVMPYCWKSGCMFRLENSLYEWDIYGKITHPPITLTERECTLSGVAPTNLLKSIHHLSLIKDEVENDFKSRVNELRGVVRTQPFGDKNVLLCTHLCVVNQLLHRPLDTHFKMGGIQPLE
jgi:broad specificity phosphatase PhoE